MCFVQLSISKEMFGIYLSDFFFLSNTFLILFIWSKLVVNWPRNGQKWSQNDKERWSENGSKWSEMVQNGPKLSKNRQEMVNMGN